MSQNMTNVYWLVMGAEKKNTAVRGLERTGDTILTSVQERLF